MIPINTIEELVNHCNINVCGKCSLEKICNSDISPILINRIAILQKHEEDKLSVILQEIVIHNRKEKLEKLLS